MSIGTFEIAWSNSEYSSDIRLHNEGFAVAKIICELIIVGISRFECVVVKGVVVVDRVEDAAAEELPSVEIDEFRANERIVVLSIFLVEGDVAAVVVVRLWRGGFGRWEGDVRPAEIIVWFEDAEGGGTVEMVDGVAITGGTMFGEEMEDGGSCRDFDEDFGVGDVEECSIGFW